MLRALALALLAASVFGEEEVLGSDAEHRERDLQAVTTTVSGPGYWGQEGNNACPGPVGSDGTCLAPSYGYGDIICSGAGSIISIWDFVQKAPKPINSPFAIPSDCKATYGTTQDQCTAINNLWNNKFAYCCPYWAGYYNAGRNVYPQLSSPNDPKALMPFFNRGYSSFLSYIGQPGLVAAKWIGNVNAQGLGGCRMFYNCNGNLNKASCQGAGGFCVWQKNVCVNNPYTVSLIRAWTPP